MESENKNNMHDILSDIRDVISGSNQTKDKNEEVLELTEVIEEQDETAHDTTLNKLDSVLSEEIPDNTPSPTSTENDGEQTNINTDQENTENNQENSIDNQENPENLGKDDDLKSDDTQDSKESTTEPAPQTEVTNEDIKNKIVAEEHPTQTETENENNIDATTTHDTQDNVMNENQNILSDKVIEESSMHLKELLNIASQSKNNIISTRSGITIEDIVIEALKPQLSLWLEKNLPSIVKEIVEKEIRRLIPNNENK